MSHSSSNWKIRIQKRLTDNWTTEKKTCEQKNEREKKGHQPNKQQMNFHIIFSRFIRVFIRCFFFFSSSLSCAVQFGSYSSVVSISSHSNSVRLYQMKTMIHCISVDENGNTFSVGMEEGNDGFVNVKRANQKNQAYKKKPNTQMRLILIRSRKWREQRGRKKMATKNLGNEK